MFTTKTGPTCPHCGSLVIPVRGCVNCKGETMRREHEKTTLEKLADVLVRRLHWLRCVLSTGHKRSKDYTLDGRALCDNCEVWVRALIPKEAP